MHVLLKHRLKLNISTESLLLSSETHKKWGGEAKWQISAVVSSWTFRFNLILMVFMSRSELFWTVTVWLYFIGEHASEPCRLWHVKILRLCLQKLFEIFRWEILHLSDSNLITFGYLKKKQWWQHALKFRGLLRQAVFLRRHIACALIYVNLIQLNQHWACWLPAPTQVWRPIQIWVQWCLPLYHS